MSTTLSPIKITLLKAREDAGLTQVQLAEKAEVRQATISDLESGKAKRIGLPVLERLCRVLGVEPGDLFELVPTPRKKRP